MTTIIPSSELVRRAVIWISEERLARPEERTSRILEEAAQRFNLSPADEEWLFRTFGR